VSGLGRLLAAALASWLAIEAPEPSAKSAALTGRSTDPDGEEGERVPIGEVVASPLCRAMETARLIAGGATADHAVLGFDPSARDAKANPEPLRAIVRTAPRAGTNRVVVGHDATFEMLTGPA